MVLNASCYGKRRTLNRLLLMSLGAEFSDCQSSTCFMAVHVVQILVLLKLSSLAFL